MESARIDASGRALFRLSWPIFIELILQLLVGNMDQVQLSHFNETAVAAVGNANQIITVVILLFNVITLAAMILISQYRGAQDMKSVNSISALSTALNLVPHELWAEAGAYLAITAAALPFQALMLNFSAFLRAGARMKSIMLITGLVNVCNIAGNAVLINGLGPLPRLGAAGAALSSSIFRVAGFLLMYYAFRQSFPEASASFRQLRPFPGGLMRRLVSIGLPSGGENLSYQLSQMSCLVFVNMMGTYVVTTRMYAVMFANCIFMLISAVSQAGQVLIGYLVGARNLDGAYACGMRILRGFCPVNVGISLLMYLAAGPLFGLFTQDARVIALGKTVMLIEVFLEIGRAFNIVLVRALQAAGDVRFPVAVGIASQWAVAVGLGYVLGVRLGMGLAGMWLAFAVDENVRAALFFIRWKSGRWRTIKTV